jgi:hypothetical protein
MHTLASWSGSLRNDSAPSFAVGKSHAVQKCNSLVHSVYAIKWRRRGALPTLSWRVTIKCAGLHGVDGCVETLSSYRRMEV